MKFKLEPRYTVIKDSDAMRYLSEAQRQQLAELQQIIANGRAFDERHPMECLCIERDWPEYETALMLISERVERENAPQPPVMVLGGVPFDKLPGNVQHAYYRWQEAQTIEAEENFHDACKKFLSGQLYKV